MSKGLIPKNPLALLFEMCVLLLGCVLALWFAIQLIEQIWVWLVVGGIVLLAIGVAVWWIRTGRTRRY